MTIDVATLPAGISANKEPCWHLITVAGQPYVDPDHVPHFDTAEQARDAIGGHTTSGTGPLTAAQLDAPCWIAMARCGYILDEDGAARMHHESGQEALEAAVDSGFTVTKSGELVCSNDCDDCGQP